MRHFKLTKLARSDLAAIWQYSVAQWGEAQAHRYQRTIHEALLEIARGDLTSKMPLAHIDHLRMVRCQQHYIFYLSGKEPLILAVFHEKMDFMARLRRRFEG